MISEEKMAHVINLMLNGLEKDKFVVFTDKGEAQREAKKVGFQFINDLNQVAENARLRITSQKNHPPEFSPQWDVLYKKYYEEELKKKLG